MTATWAFDLAACLTWMRHIAAAKPDSPMMGLDSRSTYAYLRGHQLDFTDKKIDAQVHTLEAPKGLFGY